MDIRPIGIEDIVSCQQIFDASFDDLHRRYGLKDEPADPDWLEPILTHFLDTDPSGTLIAAADGSPRAFATTFRRDDYWFLSFLFVHPSFQGRGLGRQLLRELAPTDPSVVRATVVESFQPVSTGLYASFGMVPTAIKYWLSGVSRPEWLPSLREDLRRERLTDADRADVDALDRTVLGFARPADHRWWGDTGALAWSYRYRSRLVAYAYVDNDYIGPVLADTDQTLRAVVADLVRTSEDPSTMSVNLSGHSAESFRMLVDEGARIDDSASYRFVYCSSSGPLPSSYVHHADWLP